MPEIEVSKTVVLLQHQQANTETVGKCALRIRPLQRLWPISLYCSMIHDLLFVNQCSGQSRVSVLAKCSYASYTKVGMLKTADVHKTHGRCCMRRLYMLEMCLSGILAYYRCVLL